MNEKFKALVIDNQNEKFTREVKEIDQSALKDGNVLVKVDYSSLNYKDAMILNDGGKIVRNFPFVPGIDFAGTVVSSEDDKFKKDDKIILTGFRVGEAYFGGLEADLGSSEADLGGLEGAMGSLEDHLLDLGGSENDFRCILDPTWSQNGSQNR